MHPSIICGSLLVAYITWLLARRVFRFVITRRSVAWRAIVAAVGFSFGMAPALDGELVGYGLVLLGVAAAASVTHEVWRAIRASRFARRHEHDAVAGDAGLLDDLDDRPLTELDQATVHLETLRSYMDYLERAHDGERLEAERVFAGEVAFSVLAVVVHERRLLGS